MEIARCGRGEVAQAEKQADFNKERRGKSDHARGQSLSCQSFPTDESIPRGNMTDGKGPNRYTRPTKKGAQIPAKNVLVLVTNPETSEIRRARPGQEMTPHSSWPVSVFQPEAWPSGPLFSYSCVAFFITAFQDHTG